MDNGGGIIVGVLFILLGIMLFFVFRSLLLWYWRINEAVDYLQTLTVQQQQIIQLLQQITAQSSAPVPGLADSPERRESFPPQPQ